MQAKHTPGPWTTENKQNRDWSPTLVVAPNDHCKLVADCGMTVLLPREQTIANAALIAAAPDLLAALERLLRSPMLIGNSQEANAAYADCKAAIAKATNQTAAPPSGSGKAGHSTGNRG